MKRSEDGYVPARDFLERCMGPRPEFNDGTELDPFSVNVDDGMLHNCNPSVCRDDKYAMKLDCPCVCDLLLLLCRYSF